MCTTSSLQKKRRITERIGSSTIAISFQLSAFSQRRDTILSENVINPLLLADAES